MAASKKWSSKALSIYCKSLLEVAPGKYLNCALQLCEPSFILFYNLSIKIQYDVTKNHHIIFFGIIVGLGLFCLKICLEFV